MCRRSPLKQGPDRAPQPVATAAPQGVRRHAAAVRERVHPLARSPFSHPPTLAIPDPRSSTNDRGNARLGDHASRGPGHANGALSNTRVPLTKRRPDPREIRRYTSSFTWPTNLRHASGENRKITPTRFLVSRTSTLLPSRCLATSTLGPAGQAEQRSCRPVLLLSDMAPLRVLERVLKIPDDADAVYPTVKTNTVVTDASADR